MRDFNIDFKTGGEFEKFENFCNLFNIFHLVRDLFY